MIVNCVIMSHENESWTVNSMTVKGRKIETKNFARLYVGMPIVQKWDRRDNYQ